MRNEVYPPCHNTEIGRTYYSCLIFSPTELIIILLIIVLLFGAKKLPELAKSIGQSMKIFRAETKTDDPATQQTVNTVSDAPAPAPAAAPAPAPAVPQAVTMNATAAPTTATGAEQR